MTLKPTRKISRLVVGLIFLQLLLGQQPLMANKIHIIPKPNSIIEKEGEFLISGKTVLLANKETLKSAKILQNIIINGTGQKLKIKDKASKNYIKFQVSESLKKSLGEEGYDLEVSMRGISISAVNETGLFYAIQSLRQLLPVKFEIAGEKYLFPLRVSAVKIQDTPRFSWRAYMLDEARYFHGADFVKKLLDEMALLKMNVFHWHLVDDAGWRIEIKKYPKLTSIGGFRNDSQIGPKKWKSTEYSGEAHGGFYTQEEIKEIVAYAVERQITVVPEIEMPGHASASIASYPWIGTDKKSIEVPVKFGRSRDIYDVTDPRVIQFLHDVLDEVFVLFPSKVIHIGGDEVAYDAWRESEHVKQYMEENHLDTPADLQVFFTNNISGFIESKGRRMMGWNEIMGINVHHDQKEKKNDQAAKTALAKNVIVHFWKGNIDLINKAAEKGYAIVNSLHSSTYLDYNYKSISLKKAYDFDPVPKGLRKEYIKNIYGLGTQMWSEWTPKKENVEYQTFPRIAAYAEVGWTTSETKDYQDFEKTLELLKLRWKTIGINYAE